ncbi:uncharacterized protein LOC112085253 [Eutrema salsugineum]|uniref:uncharacterized protein LOC112085253 n=1 Tax=Eutrema salsugineum TaxID=72664 RepID=UPI000CECEEEA|nr:uncharacterized protein LOC112085253 [Eutrema salsugineum]
MPCNTRSATAKLLASAIDASCRRFPADEETLAEALLRLRAKRKALSRSGKAPIEILSAEEDDGDGSSAAEEFKHLFDGSQASPEDFSNPFAPHHPLYLDREARYSANRREEVVRDRIHPELIRPRLRPIDNFFSLASKDRFVSFRLRPFHNQKYLPLDDPKLVGARKIIDDAGLIYTVLDVEPYRPIVVHEFYAKLGDLEYHNGTNRIYIRGLMFEFTPEIINKMFLVDDSLPYGEWERINIDEAVQCVSRGRKNRWEGFRSQHLTRLNGVLYKLCCCNWIPTTNNTTMVKERIRLLAYIVQGHKFNFGQMVYDQILAAARTPEMVNNKLMFPNLIFQLLSFQHTVPEHRGDRPLSGFPLKITLDPKAGKGSGDDEPQPAPSLAADLEQLATWLKRVQLRVRGGEYAELRTQVDGPATAANRDGDENRSVEGEQGDGASAEGEDSDDDDDENEWAGN